MDPDLISVSAISKACSPVSGWDIKSSSVLTPRAELEGEMGDHHVGLQSRLMSQALRKLTS